MVSPVCILFLSEKTSAEDLLSYTPSFFVLFLIIAFIFQRNGKQNRNRSFYRDLHFYKTLFRNRKVINRKYVDDSACQALTWSPKPKSHVEKQLTASTRFSSARNRDEACFQPEVFSL